jgi:hypothetical protein
MRRAIRTVLCALLVTCTTPEPAQQAATVVDSTLQAALRERLAADQAVRDQLTTRLQQGLAPDAKVVADMLAVDTANTRWLRTIVARDGWPTRARVGVDGLNAAFLLVQHADHDTAFQAWVLPHLVRAFHAGELPGQEVALLTDRLASARGVPQEYGTQTDLRDRRIVVKAIRDSAQVDARRATMGLPPMDEYLRVLDSVYFGRVRR